VVRCRRAVVRRDRNPEIYGEHIAQNVFFHDNVVKTCRPRAVEKRR
jgi:hypothetical protein